MKIVFISTMRSDPWGGSEELWSRAALRLRDEGHHVAASVIWWPRLSPRVLALRAQGLELSEYRFPHQHNLAARTWHKLRRRLPLVDEDTRWLRAQRPDLVVISQGANVDGVEWMELCQKERLPFVTIVHCNFEGWWPRDEVASSVARAYAGAKRVYCVSHHNLALLENQIGESLPNAQVIWSPFNVPAGEPPSWPEENGVWKIACVARLDPVAKGQDVLLKVLARPQWRIRPIEVSLYGGGPCQESLRSMANRLGLSNLYFRGHVNDVRSIWEQNQLLVLPSRYEGLPLALLEAMCCARPAVVTDVGGNAEMCVDGETGFVAGAPAVGDIEEALERAWARRAEWRTMGVRGRTRAEELIPKDPVGDFCRYLTGFAGN